MEEIIRNTINIALHKLGIKDTQFSVEHPADVSHGDYATNVALVCAKQLGKNPREVADQIASMLDEQVPHVSKVEIAGPGFINFYLDRDFFKEKITEILQNPESYGNNDSLKNEEIIFEYTSPNLFKPLHVGNLVGNIIGESISRIFEAGGAKVHRVNYPSDIGLTVAKGVYGLIKTKGDPAVIAQIGEAYRFGNEAYENDAHAKGEIEHINRSLYAGTDPILNLLRNRGVETSRKHLELLCAMLGTHFDKEIFESEVSDIGASTVQAHMGDVFEESDGAIVFHGEKYGFHTRVFINSQGLPTYEAKDVGNFVLKQEAFSRWTQSFVVTGGEQREYFKVLTCALREIFIDAKDKVIEHISTGFLSLTTGKMSSRKGNVLTGESLLEEIQEEAKTKAESSRADDITELTQMIAVGALKYQILRQSIGSNIVFDKEKALSFEGDSGPYLMYTHARIMSIEEKAKDVGIHADIERLPTDIYEIEHILYQFPEVIQNAQKERAPHLLVTYLTRLAGSFNTFYAHEQIVDKAHEFSPYKLALAKAVRITLHNGLHLLGIKAPKRM